MGFEFYLGLSFASVADALGEDQLYGSGREHFCALTREIHREIARESKTHGLRAVLKGFSSFPAKLFRVLGNRSRSSRPLGPKGVYGIVLHRMPNLCLSSARA